MAKSTTEAVVHNNYTADIEFWEQQIDNARQERRYAQSDAIRFQADVRIEQLSLALRIFRDAQEIPREMVGFGNREAREWITRVPPALEEYAQLREPIVAHDHIYRTDDPVEIAWLRLQISRNATPGLEELAQPNMAPLHRPDDGHFVGWASAEQYISLTDMGLTGRRLRAI